MTDKVAFLTDDGSYYTESSNVPAVGDSVRITEWNYIGEVESVEWTVTENDVTALIQLTEEEIHE
jgi:hypothetical protein